ncbi:hypothetical protein PSACC_02655 [Paramicrosporidium saccamoebae]|uniref:Uncharacterized protein n=1 Tax=Paramicrosporidium saccamoebae TaxID=1246581 RepID=A0A2H9TIG4_9FUNG|nr:hypothetical protein PSACC_02655 [Paramicrosporidium saccamoebae]
MSGQLAKIKPINPKLYDHAGQVWSERLCSIGNSKPMEAAGNEEPAGPFPRKLADMFDTLGAMVGVRAGRHCYDYVCFDNQRPSCALTLDGLRPGIPYDVSLQLLVPDIAGLSESLGNVMITTKLQCESTIVHSDRPTLLVYRSWPVRAALLGLRMMPVVLGLAREATSHRVFLMERLVLPAETVTLELAVGQRLPVYEATLEMVAHFTGIRYLMYYWRWVFAGTIIGICSFGLILVVTTVLSISLYGRLYPGEAGVESSSFSTTSRSSKISGLDEISSSKKSNRDAKLRRRRVATEVLVPNGYGSSSEDDLDLDIDIDHDHIDFHLLYARVQGRVLMIAQIGRRAIASIFGGRPLNPLTSILGVSLTNTVRCWSRKSGASKSSTESVTTTVPRRRRPNAPPDLTVLPTPMSDFSNEPLCVLPEEEGEQRFTTANQSSAYMDRYAGMESVQIEEEKGHPPGSKSLFRVALSVPVRDDLLKEAHHGLGRIVGVGQSIRVKDARVMARLDLAERLYNALDCPTTYLSEKERREEETQYIPVSISASLRKRLAQTCQILNETGVFQINTAEEDPHDRQNERRSNSREFWSLPTTVINSLPAPVREGSRLPIWGLYHRLINTIEHNNVTILSAATGSGKTTQLPQFILEHYLQAKEHYHKAPSVLVTQPRRIAAKTVAQRVAEERDNANPGTGAAIGYSVRFDSKPPSSNVNGSVVFCTAGILLRRLQREPDLRSVTHLVLDEVHERDVFTDILLLVVKNILQTRPDLRVVLMSATMESKKFVNYFESAGFRVGRVLDIEGTNHPVKENYLDDIVPMLKATGLRTDRMSPDTQDYIKAELEESVSEPEMSGIIIKDHKLQEIPFDLIASLIESIVDGRPSGAILTFLPGWDEITEMNALLAARLDASQVEIHLLHSTSPIGSADAAFRRPPPGVCKIILATNIAESSVTIPDVVYVIDSGKQKVMHYDQRLRMNVLEPCWISKANLRQRLGRAGRCQPGEYYGFYSRARAKLLPDQTLPELLRLGLDEVCLNLKAMGFTQSSARLLATAIDPPEKLAVTAALERLTSIGAIDQDEKLTPLGRLLANIPIHPAMGKMLITALIFGCLGPVLTSVALLGQRIFRPTRLPHEKFDLHNFYSRQHSGLASDHLLAHDIFSVWKENGHNFGPKMYAYESLFSRPAFRRLDESRGQIFRELNNNFGVSSSDADVNSGNDALVRLILTSGFYPDVGITSGKRNSYKLRRVPHASVVGGSMNHVLGTGNITAALEQRGRRSHGGISSRNTRMGPEFIIYEELVDIGQKLISKTTAVDPLSFLLFAERTSYKRFRGARDTEFQQLHIDNWLAYRADNISDLKLISELGLHWNDFVQFVIYKQLGGEMLSPHEEECVAIIKETILMFTKELTCSVGAPTIIDWFNTHGIADWFITRGQTIWLCSAVQKRRIAMHGTSMAELVRYLQGILCERVRDTMLQVDRGDYCNHDPYSDFPQELSHNATISAPHMHAYALEHSLSVLTPGVHRILDVGSGSGYLTTCYGKLDADYLVVGVEHIPELVDQALANTSRHHKDLLDSGQLRYVVGDGREGYPDLAPYDVIHVGAAATSRPARLLSQLKAGGVLIVPVGKWEPEQQIIIYRKDEEGNVSEQATLPVRYVPLTDRATQEKIW